MISRPVSVSTSCIPNPDAALLDSFARAGVACAEISLPGRDYADFPKQLKDYISFIEKETGCPVRIISVGPDREAIVVR